MELATTFVVNGIRNELAALQDTMVFERWDPGLDLSNKAATKLWSEAPVFTTESHLAVSMHQQQQNEVA
jgi:hypothetical protein